MAIIKVAKGGRTIKGAINYVGKKAKITAGKDVSDDYKRAINEMQDTKYFYNKTEGRTYKHYVQSFAPNEIDMKTANEMALRWAEENFKGYEVLIGTHTDKDHIHNHFIVNSVNFETGMKFNKNKHFLDELKASNDRLCIEYGLQITQKNREVGEIRDYNQAKYQLLKRIDEGTATKSYIVDMAAAVQIAASRSQNKYEFIKNMKLSGYKTNWIDNRKHVTFEIAEDRKVRLSNLEKTFGDNFFTKEGLSNEFQRVETETEFSGNSERQDITYNQSKPIRVRKQSAEGVPDRVFREVREVEQGLKQYSLTGREELRNAEKERQRIQRENEQQRRELEEQQRETKRGNREHSQGMER